MGGGVGAFRAAAAVPCAGRAAERGGLVAGRVRGDRSCGRLRAPAPAAPAAANAALALSMLLLLSRPLRAAYGLAPERAAAFGAGSGEARRAEERAPVSAAHGYAAGCGALAQLRPDAGGQRGALRELLQARSRPRPAPRLSVWAAHAAAENLRGQGASVVSGGGAIAATAKGRAVPVRRARRYARCANRRGVTSGHAAGAQGLKALMRADADDLAHAAPPGEAGGTGDLRAAAAEAAARGEQAASPSSAGAAAAAATPAWALQAPRVAVLAHEGRGARPCMRPPSCRRAVSAGRGWLVPRRQPERSVLLSRIASCNLASHFMAIG